MQILCRANWQFAGLEPGMIILFGVKVSLMETDDLFYSIEVTVIPEMTVTSYLGDTPDQSQGASLFCICLSSIHSGNSQDQAAPFFSLGYKGHLPYNISGREKS